MASHGASSRVVPDGTTRDRFHNMTSISDLQTLVNNVRLDGPASTTTIDDIAESIKTKLALDVDDTTYRSLATILAKGCSISSNSVADENSNQNGGVRKVQRMNKSPLQQQQQQDGTGTEHESCSAESSSISPETGDSSTAARVIPSKSSKAPQDFNQNVIRSEENEYIRGRSPARSMNPLRIFTGRRPPTPDRSRMPTPDRSRKHTTPLRSREKISPRTRSRSPFRRFFRSNNKSQEQEIAAPVSAHIPVPSPAPVPTAAPVPDSATSVSASSPAHAHVVDAAPGTANVKSVLQPSHTNFNRSFDRPPSGRSVPSLQSCLPPTPVKPPFSPTESSNSSSPHEDEVTTFAAPASKSPESTSSNDRQVRQNLSSSSAGNTELPQFQGCSIQVDGEVEEGHERASNRDQSSNFHREVSDPIDKKGGNVTCDVERKNPPFSCQVTFGNLVQTVSSETNASDGSSSKKSDMDEVPVSNSDQEMSATSLGNEQDQNGARSASRLSTSFPSLSRRSRSLTPSSVREGGHEHARASISPQRHLESANSADALSTDDSVTQRSFSPTGPCKGGPAEGPRISGLNPAHRASVPPLSKVDQMNISPFIAKSPSRSTTDADLCNTSKTEKLQHISVGSNPSSEPIDNASGFTDQTAENIFNVDLKPKTKKANFRTKRPGLRRNINKIARAASENVEKTVLSTAAVDCSSRAPFVPIHRPIDLVSSFETGTEGNNNSADCSDTASDLSAMETDDDSLSDLDLGEKAAIHYPSSSGVSNVQFAVGISVNNPTSPRRRRVTRRRPHRFEKTHRSNLGVLKNTEGHVGPGFSFEKSDSTDHSVQSNSSSDGIDYTGKFGLLQSMRDEARNFYLTGDYRSSVLSYTKAIQLVANEGLEYDKKIFAILLSNRAAGLLMLGAFEAAAADCRRALPGVSSSSVKNLSHDSGPVLKSKLLTRLGRALLKLGDVREADRAFSEAIEIAQTSLNVCRQIHPREELEKDEKMLNQVITDANLAKNDAVRYNEIATKIARNDVPSLQRSIASERRTNVELLGHVNIALSTASGCYSLHEKKVSLLANLRRWREVAGHCERFASINVKLDGVFTGDMAKKFPFPGVAPAKSLTPTFFGYSNDEDYRSAGLKLSSKAAGEAVLRLPYSMTSFYLRALRLEERYPAAESAIQTLEKFVNERAESHPYERLRVKFAWLPRERNKLNRTKRGREKGDELFRAGDFDLAASQYAACLNIDSEGMDNIVGANNAGGRLHAVLHCNRAACLMTQLKYIDAVTECTAALRIHSRYMKAMLRRARCYSRLERYEESVVEYKRWLELVEEAKKSSDSTTVFITPCLFDGPRDVSSEDIMIVQKELEEILRAKQKKEATVRDEARFRHERQKFHNEAFADAQRRRENWYSQKGNSGSRRWDSFAGKSPKRSSKNYHKNQHRSDSWNGRSDNWRQSQHTGYKSNCERQKVSNILDSESDHYHVLQVTPSATNEEIKKSYRKLALKFHPDKNKDTKAADTFRRIKLAYEILMDVSSRKQYDLERVLKCSI